MNVRMLVALATVTAALTLAPAAQAEITSVLGGDVACTTEGDGVRFCGSSSPRSTSKAFDNVPIDVNVAFPPAPAMGPDGNFPLVMIFHGYGGGKVSLATMRRFLDRGYATFSMTDRGFRESCGSAASKAADPAGCENGYIRLIDARYEVRDAQEFAGRLADDGVIDPQRIGAIGGSYGGGMSLALGILKDRKMLVDNSIVPWASPAGKAMQIAAAAPFITWSDLAYSLTPNGSTLDYVANAAYKGRFGVMKESLVNGLYLSGISAPGFYAAAGTAPDADLAGWRNRLLAGEPYDGDPTAAAILTEIKRHHSPYYLDHSQRPAPLLLANGWTDDLFPVDEMVRFYNRTRTEYPNAPISLFASELAGHPRSQNKADAAALLVNRQNAWFDFYIKGVGKPRFLGVEAFTQTCPAAAPSAGPFRAPNWAKIAKGEVRLGSKAKRTIAPDGGDPAIAATFDPVTGGGACAQTSGANEAGTANYRLIKAPKGGFTLLGSPTVIADFKLPGKTSQVAARLLDVGSDGEQTLVARGLWRPATGGPTRQVFQLHPAAWEFAAGHVAKLQLLAKDSGGGGLGGYGRPSNDQKPVTVSNLELRLPVLEKPGALPGFVKAPKTKFVPKGYKPARDFEGFGNVRPRLGKGHLPIAAKRIGLTVICPRAWAACTNGEVRVVAAGGPLVGPFLLAQGSFGANGGKLALPLSGVANGYFDRHESLRVRVSIDTAEIDNPSVSFRKAR